jgi:1,4-dihydroxy-2-naphthoate octaprenyltransferase
MTSVAAVIVANEFPDFEADRQTAKNNLVVILGKRVALYLYRALIMLSLFFAFTTSVCYFSIPYYFLPLLLVPVVMKITYESRELLDSDHRKISSLCANTILLNLMVNLMPLVVLILHLVRHAS